MSWIKYLDLFLAAVIILMFYKKIVSLVFEKKEENTFIKKFISVIIPAILILIINFYVKNIFKGILTLPFIAITIYTFFGGNYRKSLLYAAISTIYIFLGEFFLSIVYTNFSYDFTFVIDNIFGGTIGTLLTILFALPFLFWPKINKKIMKYSEKLSNKPETTVVAILIELLLCSLTYRITMKIQTKISIIMNILIVVIIGVIIYILFLEYKKSERLSENYNELLIYLEKYEKELTEKRKIIHDYKNQIIIIKGYLDCKTKLEAYLNELLKEQKAICENELINNIDKLPKGLKGLIYYKFSQVNKKLKIKINIDEKSNIFDKFNAKKTKDVLKVIGILLDNAIEATDIEKKPYIYISMYVENKRFKIKIVNSCTKIIKAKNLMEAGYSTKGIGRGYGISLISDILKSNKDISLNLSNINNEFTALVEIKI